MEYIQRTGMWSGSHSLLDHASCLGYDQVHVMVYVGLEVVIHSWCRETDSHN